MIEEIALAELTRINVEPGEVLVLRARIRSQQDMQDLRAQVQAIFPANRVVVFPKDMDITAVNFKALTNGS